MVGSLLRQVQGASGKELTVTMVTCVTRYPVVNHVDLVLLFADGIDNAQHCRHMIDGRTVYPHVLFILNSAVGV